MKRAITIIILILVVLGVGYYLFRISPQQDANNNSSSYSSDFNLNNLPKITEPSPVDPSVDHILGNPQAKNTIVVFEDYECPACAAYAPVVRQIPSTFQDTRLVVRDFPLIGVHKFAVQSAYAMEAAAEQGKFWEMYDLMYSKQPEWSVLDDPTSQFVDYAKQAGVADLQKFQTDMSNGMFKSRVEKDLREAMALNLQGTPTFIFNGHQIQAGQLADMEKEVQPYYNK